MLHLSQRERWRELVKLDPLSHSITYLPYTQCFHDCCQKRSAAAFSLIITDTSAEALRLEQRTLHAIQPPCT